MPELDIAAIANDAVEPVALTPEVGDQPGSTPASVETTVQPEAELSDAEKAEKAQSRKEARRFAQLRRENAELHRELGRREGRGEVAQPTTTDQPPAAPKQSDFNNFDDYMAAVVAHAGEAAAAKVAKQFEGKIGRDAPQQNGQAFRQAAAKEAKEKGISGFDEAMESIVSGETVTSPAISHYVIEEADNKAAMVAWLADHPDESERIAKLDPVKAGAALAKVDASLGAKPRQVSQAPAPVPQPTGGGTAQLSIERMGHEDIRKMVGKWSKGR